MEQEEQTKNALPAPEPAATTSDLRNFREIALDIIRRNPLLIGLDVLRRLLLPTERVGYALARNLVAASLSSTLDEQLKETEVSALRNAAFAIFGRYAGNQDDGPELASEGVTKYWLSKRGWSPSLIAELLGDPDVPKVRGQAHPTYRRDRVERAEEDPRLVPRIARAKAAQEERERKWAEQERKWAKQAAEEQEDELQESPPIKPDPKHRWEISEPTVEEIEAALKQVAPAHLPVNSRLVRTIPNLRQAGRLLAMVCNATTEPRESTASWVPRSSSRSGVACHAEGKRKTLVELSYRWDTGSRIRLDHDLSREVMDIVLQSYPELEQYEDIIGFRPWRVIESVLLEHFAP